MTDTIYGLTDEGFNAKTQALVRDDLDENVRAVAPSLPLGDGTVLGNYNGILSQLYGELWDLGQAAWAARDPDRATKAAMVSVAAITGTAQLAAKPSTVIESCCGVPGTDLPEGTAAVTGGLDTSLPPTNRRFHSTVDATIAAVPVYATTHVYAAGDRVTNASRVYQALSPGGTSGTVTPPTGTADDFLDSSVHWQYVGEGTGAIDVPWESDLTGPIVGVAKDISIINTQVSGLQSVRNLLDAKQGTNIETDGALRLRREEELATGGNAPKDAIRADLLNQENVPGVESVSVFMNVEDVTDADGVPPHSVEAVIVGGVDQDIYNTLLASVAGGIRTHGTTVGSALDAEGNTQVEKFTRPTLILIYMYLTVEFDATAYPIDGDAEIKSAIATFGQASKVGKDAVPKQLGAQAFSVDGVDNIDTLIYTDVIGTPVAWTATHAYVATPGSRSVVTNDGRTYICITSGTSAGSGGPTGMGTNITDGSAHWYALDNKIVITSRQLASYDTSRMTVSSSAVTP